jgi:hypothetical protein
VATVTLVRDEAEERTLRDSLRQLPREGLRVAVSDGGSGPEFVEFVRTLASFTVVPSAEPGLVGQVKASLRAAASWPSPFLLYTEPDKGLFFGRRLASFISKAPDAADVGIVLAARDENSFGTFPEFQQLTEGAFNTLCAATVGEPGDYCYGPFLMNRGLTRHLDELKADLGWGWRPFIFATARRLGYRIVHHVDNLPCPPEQRANDESERIHRLRQLRQNVEGLILSFGRPMA